jgi:hypothetical protein
MYISTVLHECKIRFFTLNEEHKLRVLENKVLGRIFGQKREMVTGEWREFIVMSFVICILHLVC